MKKMYNQPELEVITLKTEYLMQGVTVSEGGDPPGDNTAHMPRRGTVIE